ncbi:hypothetical protein II582_00300 [bacterium]|nr:hypothetical protein [bacterium]
MRDMIAFLSLFFIAVSNSAPSIQHTSATNIRFAHLYILNVGTSQLNSIAVSGLILQKSILSSHLQDNSFIAEISDSCSAGVIEVSFLMFSAIILFDSFKSIHAASNAYSVEMWFSNLGLLHS